jgi:hypothetical protein
MDEKRRFNRLDISVEIELERIDQEDMTTVRYLKVKTLDISKGGIGFESDYDFAIGATFTAFITIWTGEKLQTIFKVIRKMKQKTATSTTAASSSACRILML